MVRFQNVCGDCGFLWYPKPHKCPHCKSRATGVNYTVPLVIVILILSLALAWVITSKKKVINNPSKEPNECCRGSHGHEETYYKVFRETIYESIHEPATRKTAVTDFSPLPSKKPEKPHRTVEPKKEKREEKKEGRKLLYVKEYAPWKEVERKEEQTQEQDYPCTASQRSDRPRLKVKSSMSCWDTDNRTWGVMGSVTNGGSATARNVIVKITVVLSSGSHTFEKRLSRDIYPGGKVEFESRYKHNVYVEDFSLEVSYGN